MKKQVVVLVLAAVLVFGCAVGGTLAWLSARTQTIVNVFTAGDVKISLTETTTDYKMVPGASIDKDPTITVDNSSEKSYIFVKLDETPNVRDFLTYEIADGWTELTVDAEGTPVSGVYYRIYEDDAAVDGATYSVIKDNTVTVNDEVTKNQLNALTEGTCPTISVTAFAVQYDNISEVAEEPARAAAAWAEVKDLPAPANP